MNMHGNLLNYADRKDVNVCANLVLPSLLLWKPKNSKWGVQTLGRPGWREWRPGDSPLSPAFPIPAVLISFSVSLCLPLPYSLSVSLPLSIFLSLCLLHFYFSLLTVFLFCLLVSECLCLYIVDSMSQLLYDSETLFLSDSMSLPIFVSVSLIP